MASEAIRPSRRKYLTVEERVKAGRAQRSAVSRSGLGEIHTHKRSFKPIDVLLKADENRMAKLLPVKYKRMLASAFAFFRGSVSIMAADLAGEPNTGLMAQLCGDAHVQNLGSFEAPDGRLVFDINDFDETIRGPWEWDVKRMATSIVLAGYDSNHRRSECACAVEAFAGSYAGTLEIFAKQPILVAARHQVHRVKRAEAISAAFQQAERSNPCDLLKKYTETGAGGRVRFKNIANALWRIRGKERQDVLHSLDLYMKSLAPERLHLFDFFEPLDVAFKIVGTGSVGLRNYVILMRGNGAEDPLFLQIKEEVESIYAPYLKSKQFASQGERVAEGQRKVQPLSDLLLGWTQIGKEEYLVRQLNDHKGGIDLTHLRGEGLTSLAAVAGELLARGHARSGDAVTINSYIGGGDKVVKGFEQYALEYAAVAEADFESFQRAVKEGRIKVAA